MRANTKTNNWIAGIVLTSFLGGMVSLPITANAQRNLDRESARRQQKKNEWRNLGYAAGALGVLGLVKKNNILTFAGLGGGLYSAWRYEQDRKSQSAIDRQRADVFSRPYINRDGKRYKRQTVWRNGQKYYRFERTR